MARSPHRLSHFWPALAILLAATPAMAEQLVMPFSCFALDGGVRLRPAEPQVYRVYGPRQSHVFSVCSPVDANQCRNWMIHRFDVDCGGERVSWLRVVEAAARFRRNSAWVEDGQMHLTMQSLDRGDPGRRWDPDDGAEEMEAVVLPPGFAPTLGLPVQFLSRDGERAEDGEASGAREDGSWDAPAREALPRKSEEATPRPPKKSDKVAAAEPSKALAAETAPPAEKKAAQPPTVKSAPGAASPPDANTKTPEPARAEAPKLPEGIVTPTIINGANGPDVPAPDASASAPTSPGASASAATSQPSVTEPSEAPQSPASAKDAANTKTSVLDVSALAGDRQFAVPVVEPRLLWGGLAAAGVLVLSAIFLVSRRRDGAQAQRDQQRDLGSVTFEAAAKTGTSLVAVGGPSVLAAMPTGGARAVVATGMPGELDIPTSLPEALAVLGTNADAPTEVIKKIVDGLRQSWHSDLARSDEDRAYRERRMQQLNAAWELVLRSRPAAA